jgi:predicted Fe-Mo cluster-binding NifX family protein
MRVAVAHWQGRVSPVFDEARNLLLVDVGNGMERGRQNLRLDADEPHALAGKLADWDTDVVICGAISWPLEMALASAGVRVVPQTCGEVENVIGAFNSGHLTDTAFLMPGCPGRQQGIRMRCCQKAVDKTPAGLLVTAKDDGKVNHEAW